MGFVKRKRKEKAEQMERQMGYVPNFFKSLGMFFYSKSLAICEVGVKLFLFLKVVLLNLSSSVYLG